MNECSHVYGHMVLVLVGMLLMLGVVLVLAAVVAAAHADARIEQMQPEVTRTSLAVTR